MGGRTEDAMALLGITSYPFSGSTLKKAWIEMVTKWHPDVNKARDATEKTKRINDAYSLLKNLAIDEIEQPKPEPIFHKAPPTLFTEECPSCGGHGTITRELFMGLVPCPKCGGETFYFTDRPVPCRKCNGTGTYHDLNGKPFKCFKCSGTGIFTLKWKVKCDCYAGKVPKHEITTETCPKCDGSGRIKIERFNPVIRAGAVL